MEISFVLSFLYNAIFHLLLLFFFGTLFKRQSRRDPITKRPFLCRDFLGAMMMLHFVGFSFYSSWWAKTLIKIYGIEDGSSLLGLLHIIMFPFVFFVWIAAFLEMEKFHGTPTISGIMRKAYGKIPSLITWVLIVGFSIVMIMQKLELMTQFTKSEKSIFSLSRNGLDFFLRLVKMVSLSLDIPLLIAYLVVVADMFSMVIPKRRQPWFSEQVRIGIIIGIITLVSIPLKFSPWWANIKLIMPFYLYFFSGLAVPFLSLVWGFKVSSRSFYLTTGIFMIIFCASLLFGFIKETSFMSTIVGGFQRVKSSNLVDFAKIGSIFGNIVAALAFFIDHYIMNRKLVWKEDSYYGA